jgi:hypothetical protein
MGIKKSELKQLQQTASNMVRTLTEMTSQTGELSMAQEMNDVMIELSASQGIIGSALVKALNIK